MLTAYATDAGTVKKINQDSLIIMEARVEENDLEFAAVCDGMGGLKNGEFASASMSEDLKVWFEKTVAGLPYGGLARKDLISSLNEAVLWAGRKLRRYREQYGSCGTTVAGVVLYRGRYLCVNVGDSRVYKIGKDGIQQLTHDQTVAQQMFDDGKITKKEAAEHPGQSILLQCVGASAEVVPDYTWGVYREGDTFLLCSDGFRHKYSEKEMRSAFHPGKTASEEEMEKAAKKAIDKVMSRRERDNITVVLVAAKEQADA